MPPQLGAALTAALSAATSVIEQIDVPSAIITSVPSIPTSAVSSAEDALHALWSQAESLISSVYPSASVTDVASLTWPSTVVLGSSTIPITPSTPKPSSTFSTNIAAQTSPVSPTNTAATSGNPSPQKDNHLGIILGVVLGFIALLTLLGIFWFLHRRRRRTGSFTRHTEKPSDTEIQSWRTPMAMAQHESRWSDVHNRLVAPAPAAGLHPAFSHQQSYEAPSPSRANTSYDGGYYSSGSSENPFYTPTEVAELSATHSRQQSLETYPLHASHDRPTMHFLPAAMGSQQSVISPVSPVSQYEPQTPLHGRFSYDLQRQKSNNNNPFASDEDYEAGDMVPPVPVRSPDRRSSSRVHYPSGAEVQHFDFGLNGRGAGYRGDDGGDAWRGGRGSWGRGDEWKRSEDLGRRVELE